MQVVWLILVGCEYTRLFPFYLLCTTYCTPHWVKNVYSWAGSGREIWYDCAKMSDLDPDGTLSSVPQHLSRANLLGNWASVVLSEEFLNCTQVLIHALKDGQKNAPENYQKAKNRSRWGSSTTEANVIERWLKNDQGEATLTARKNIKINYSTLWRRCSNPEAYGIRPVAESEFRDALKTEPIFTLTGSRGNRYKILKRRQKPVCVIQALVQCQGHSELPLKVAWILLFDSKHCGNNDYFLIMVVLFQRSVLG